MSKENEHYRVLHDELPTEHEDKLLRLLHLVIRFSVRILAILMVLVILWGIGDVVYVLYQRLLTPPYFLLNINDIFQTFGAFMVVLIAIEIFINIRLYLGTNTLPIKLVVATALMAIARKIIVLDVDQIDAIYVAAIGFVTVALGVTYWLLGKVESDR